MRQFGFAGHNDHKSRQAAKALGDLVAEIREVDGRKDIVSPAFGSAKAHKLLTSWAPDAVRSAMMPAESPDQRLALAV